MFFKNLSFWSNVNIKILVTIQGRDTFKGFLIQARDAVTNEWIGGWLEGPNFKIHPECSAVTHADPKEKQQATFIWQAPQHISQGSVYFTYVHFYFTMRITIISFFIFLSIATTHNYKSM